MPIRLSSGLLSVFLRLVPPLRGGSRATHRGPRLAALGMITGALVLDPGLSPARSPTTCPDPDLVYVLDPVNVTGRRHNLLRPVARELAYFRGADLIIERPERVLRYTSSGGGSGLRLRVGRAQGVDANDPEAIVHFMFYDLDDRVRPGENGRFLLIDGDMYWPVCATLPRQ